MRWSSFPLVLACVLSTGCPNGDEPPSCAPADTIDTACAPQYIATFDNVYSNTIATDCGANKGACHSASGAGGMSLADPATAHAQLLKGRVTPNDPACSEIIVRTHGVGEDYQMPPGPPLVPAERCSLVKWIAGGAPGPGEPLP